MIWLDFYENCDSLWTDEKKYSDLENIRIRQIKDVEDGQ